MIAIPTSEEPFVEEDSLKLTPAWLSYLTALQRNFNTTLEHSGDKAGLYGETPTTQAAKITDPTGGVTVDAEARASIVLIIDALEGIGIASK